MKYEEAQSALAAPAGRAQTPEARVRALSELAQFYGYCGKTLWCFEMNREPILSCPVLPFKSWGEFDEFFRSVPKALDFGALLSLAGETCRKTIEEAAAAHLDSAEASSWMELAGVADLSADDRDVERAHARATELYEKLGDEEGLGEVCMGRAHRARYRTYDTILCRRFLEEARKHFDRAGSVLGSARAVSRLAETYDPGINNGVDADVGRMEALYAEASALFDRAGDKVSAANTLAGLADFLREAGLTEREEGALLRCLGYIEKNFDGEDLAQNYGAVAAFYERRGNQEKGADYRRKASALRPS